VLTSPTGYGLSSSEYGLLFLPQVITAVTASLLGARLTARVGLKRTYLTGLVASLIAMAVLALSQLAVHDRPVALAMLLSATALLGAGFGLAVPALNALAAAFHPRTPDTAVLVLNALLGLGTALAPALIAVFVHLGFWWGLPILSSLLLVVIITASLPLSMAIGATAAARGGLPRGFWLFGAVALLYGFCETANGNWAQLDLTTEVGATATTASLALTAFWTMVTVGRVLFASLERVLAPRWTYRVLPFALAATFALISALPRDRSTLGVAAFALAGLCCSALLPLTISFGQDAFPAVPAAVSGGVIAAYQLGYGIAAFGIGPVHASGIPLSTVYAAAGVIAVVMGGLAVAVTRRS
jgi:fucose permease